jgi:hypothetical protein
VAIDCTPKRLAHGLHVHQINRPVGNNLFDHTPGFPVGVAREAFHGHIDIGRLREPGGIGKRAKADDSPSAEAMLEYSRGLARTIKEALLLLALGQSRLR